MTDPIDTTTLRSLQESAGAEFVAELADAFCEEAPKMAASLRTAVAAGDVDAFRRAAHSLKSNGLTFGAAGLGALARALELDAQAVVQDGQAARLDPLDAELARVYPALRELTHA